MKNAPMRFCGLSLHHNPGTLSVSESGNIRELISPCCDPDSTGLGLRVTVVSGEGEFYGTDCLEQYRQLEALQKAQKRGKLMLPRRDALYAFLKELSLTAPPLENVVRYRFKFVGAKSSRASGSCPEVYYTRSDGESLWDIGYRFGIGVERLVELNPHIAHIDDLSENERVRLC